MNNKDIARYTYRYKDGTQHMVPMVRGEKEQIIKDYKGIWKVYDREVGCSEPFDVMKILYL